MNWPEYYLTIAEAVKLKSKDQNTQIGAVIVGSDKQIISTGYNSFPRNIVDDNDERQVRPEKYYWMEHAERNAIYNAALNGVSTKGTSIYLTCGVPCCDCARGIINAGIKKVYCKEIDTTKNRLQWDEHAERSVEMFNEADVDVIFYSTKQKKN